MSDLMLHGVLNMPLPDDPSKIDLVTWVQFKDRATQASSRIEELEASKNEALNQLESALYSVSVLEKRVKSLIDENADLKAKLAKAIKTLEYYAGYWADDKTFVRTDDGGELASETIKELTGGQSHE